MDQNISTAVILVAALIIFFSVTVGTYSSIQALSMQKEGIEKVMIKAEELVEKEGEKRQEYNEFKDRKDDFQNMLPLGRDDARTLMLINSMANANNIVITAVGVSDGVSVGRTTRRTPASQGTADEKVKTVNLSFNATYGDFKAFLTNLEKSRRIFDVVAIDFLGSAGRVFSFEVAIHTYRMENQF